MNQPRRTSPLQQALGTLRIDMRSVEIELELVRAELLARTVAQ